MEAFLHEGSLFPDDFSLCQIDKGLGSTGGQLDTKSTDPSWPVALLPSTRSLELRV